MSRPSAFDPHCYELAEYFLLNEPGEHNTEENKRRLAQDIQDAVEDYFRELERK